MSICFPSIALKKKNPLFELLFFFICSFIVHPGNWLTALTCGYSQHIGFVTTGYCNGSAVYTDKIPRLTVSVSEESFVNQAQNRNLSPKMTKPKFIQHLKQFLSLSI